MHMIIIIFISYLCIFIITFILIHKYIFKLKIQQQRIYKIRETSDRRGIMNI